MISSVLLQLLYKLIERSVNVYKRSKLIKRLGTLGNVFKSLFNFNAG